MNSVNPLALVLFCVTLSGSAQSRWPYIQAQVTADPLLIADDGTGNITLDLRTKRLGVGFSAQYQFSELQSTNFNTDYERSSFTVSGALYFPLHCVHPGGNRITALPCPAWGPANGKRRNREGNTCMSGAIYLKLGYRHEQISYLMTTRDDTGLPDLSYAFAIRNDGLDSRLGYAVQYWRITVEVGYSAFVSFPVTSGVVDLFGEDLYTGLHPFKYRLELVPDLRIGFNIPITHNQH